MTTSVKERPLLFKGAMVRAALNDTKNQTRRPINMDRLAVVPRRRITADWFGNMEVKAGVRTHGTMNRLGAVCGVSTNGKELGLKPGEFDFLCPYVTGTTSLKRTDDDKTYWKITPVGENQLWVRETWADGTKVYPCNQFEYRATAHIADADLKEHGRGCTYEKDGKKNFECYRCAGFKWRPSIHMPRAVSRISLSVKDVCVQRLQDITEEDALAEGIEKLHHLYGVSESGVECGDTARDAYAKLWDSINGLGSWDANDWVWKNIISTSEAMTMIQFDTRKEWLAFRRTGIGASDAPVIAGIVAWSSPYKLALQKRGLVPEEDETVRMSLGRVIEPWVRRRLMEETGWAVHHNDDYTYPEGPGYPEEGKIEVFQSDDHPWMFCTPDGVIMAQDDKRGHGLLEIKGIGFITKEAMDDPESEERRVWDTQIQHGMGATGFKWGVVAVVISNQSFKWYVVERDDKRIAELVAMEHAFWTNLQADVFPEIDGSEATEQSIRRRYKPSGKPVSLSAGSVIDFEEWDLFSRQSAETEKKAAASKNRLMAAMGNNSFAVLPNGVKLTWKEDARGARVLRRMK